MEEQPRKNSSGNCLTVDCGRCEARVQGEILAVHETTTYDYEVNVALPDRRISFIVCPSCQEALVASQVWEGEDESGISIWTRPVRIWPVPDRGALAAIPAIVRVSLEEAQLCHRANAYTACAVMSGRALEGACVHFGTKHQNLARGLKELRDRTLIDERLFQWGEELRKHRNIAAHASEERISREDATDLLDFVHAICEYVFVLTPKFQSFMARRTSDTSALPATVDDDKSSRENANSA